ncbi:AimR family lysis-lysogeny pheromone receptor [Terribacillus saccharophilus]|uniref:AimR family lysis-lysogeny pheromone receptor n=1 Tax=Terribacillus saccharophilus TaxID=361277 RepID=UPI003981F2D4
MNQSSLRKEATDLGKLPAAMSRMTDIWSFIQLVETNHDVKQITDMTAKFCLQSDSAAVNFAAMDFLGMNFFEKELQLLVDRNKRSANRRNRTYACLYELIIQYQAYKLPGNEFDRQINRLQVDFPEGKALVLIGRIYQHFHNHDYHMIGYYLDELQDTIMLIKDYFMRVMMGVRVDKLLFLYHWKRNELIIARKHGRSILNHTYLPGQRAMQHYKMGLTYLFDDKIASFSHLAEGSKMAKRYNAECLVQMLEKQVLPIVAAYFGIPHAYLTDDPLALAYIEYQLGEVGRARKRYPIWKAEKQTAFYKFFYGLIHHKKDHLVASYHQFIHRHKDFYFSRFPMYAIQEMDNSRPSFD